MNFSMLILMMLSLISGSLLTWFFLDNYFMYMNIDVKMMTMLMLFMSMIFGYFVYFKNLLNLYIYSFFFSSMWFLNYMYLWIYWPFFNMGVEVYSLDKKWIEFMGKNLILDVIKEIKVNMKLYKIFMFMFIASMSLLLIYITL